MIDVWILHGIFYDVRKQRYTNLTWPNFHTKMYLGLSMLLHRISVSNPTNSFLVFSVSFAKILPSGRKFHTLFCHMNYPGAPSLFFETRLHSQYKKEYHCHLGFISQGAAWIPCSGEVQSFQKIFWNSASKSQNQLLGEKEAHRIGLALTLNSLDVHIPI